MPEKEFKKAINIAKSGRPGIQFKDLALEIQWSNVKKDKIIAVKKY